MGTTCKGIVKGNVIELEAPLPYPEGTEVSVQVEPLAQGEAVVVDLPPPSEEAIRKFEALIGIGHSGLGDVGRNKHKYLAEAYDERKRETPKAGE